MGFCDSSDIRWTICKQSAPRSRQTTTPAPHHSIFTGRMLFLMHNRQCQTTEGNFLMMCLLDTLVCPADLIEMPLGVWT